MTPSPLPGDGRITRVWLERLALAVVFGTLFLWSFRLNETMNDWVLYGQGIALIFLPAGIKNVAVMVGKGWGTLGIVVAMFWVSFDFWGENRPLTNFLYVLTSVGSSYVAIQLGMRALRIEPDLRQLRFWHLPLIDVLTTSLHGLTTNAFFIAAGMKTNNFWGNAMAMMVGDFVGNLLVMMCLWGMVSTLHQRRTGQYNL